MEFKEKSELISSTRILLGDIKRHSPCEAKHMFSLSEEEYLKMRLDHEKYKKMLADEG